VLRSVLLRQTSFLGALALGHISVDGGVRRAGAFFDYFDPPAEEPPKLVVR
jgi:hypothetical protein